MRLVPDRFVVTAIVRELDDDNNVVSERQADPAVLFGAKALEQWASDFEALLADAEVAEPAQEPDPPPTRAARKKG